jgi:putative ABC transport system permease protein
MGTRTRKVIRDVTLRRTRTALVSISIFIGVLGVVTLSSAGDILINKLQSDLVEDELPMFTAGVDLDEGVSVADVDQAAVLDHLRSFPGVTAVQGGLSGRAYWRDPADQGFIEGIIRSYSDPLDAIVIEPLTLIEGHYPRPGQHEVVIERRMAEHYGLAVGDLIVIRILSQLSETPGAVSEIPEETWTIAGIVFHPYLGDSNRRSLYALPDDAATISGIDHYTLLNARFTDFATADATADDFQFFINDTTPFTVNWIDILDPANNQFIQEMQDWTSTLRALALLAMLVSSFLVVTVISTIVIEQRRQIGVMKSLGATRADNFRMYAGIAVMYGVIGMIPGVLLGIPAGYVLAVKVSPLMNVLVEHFTVSYPAVITGVVMGIVMPFLASLLPVLLGTRVTIREAITDLGISSRFGYSPVARLIHWLPLPASIRQALANIYQKKGRLAMTWITLTLAVGAFMGVIAVFVSLDDALERIFDTFNYELELYPISPDDYDYAAVKTLIETHIDGLNGVYPTSNTTTNIVLAKAPRPGGPDMTFSVWTNGFDPNTDSVRLDLEAGTAWQDDPERDGVVITRSVADRIGKGVGDTITLRGDAQTLDVEIIGIDRFPFDDIFARWQTVAALSGDDAPQSYALRFADHNLSGADVDRKTGEIRETLLHNGIVPGFWNQRASEEENANTVLTAGLVFNIASLVMAAVGAIGLLTMLFISVFERQREIGVMRSIGASSRSIAGQFLTEGLLIGVLAWMVGVPLSYGVARILTNVLPISEFGFIYPPVVLPLGLVGMLLTATLASLWPSLSAARRTVSDILRYQ